MYTEYSSTFISSWMLLHMILKFSSFVVLLGLLKVCIAIFFFAQMPNTAFSTNQPWGKSKSAVFTQPFPKLVNVVKSHVSVGI